MADQLSPGVVVREIDMSATVPVVGTSGGATVAEWRSLDGQP